MASKIPPNPLPPTSTTTTTIPSHPLSTNAEPQASPASSTTSSTASSIAGDSTPSNEHGGSNSNSNTSNRALQRPKLGTRKSSGTIIVPREHPRVELKEGDEVFDEDDARAMSPRRSSQDLEKMGRDARAQLNEHAKALQKSLLDIFNRVEAVKEEHDKLDNNNKFLQKYIGDLMSTSKITATGAGGTRKK